MSTITTNTTTSGKKRKRSYTPGNPRLYCTYAHCTASFARMEHLRRHQAIHEGSESFGCSICGLSFTRKDTLMRHKRKQHGEEAPNTQNEAYQKQPSYEPYKSDISVDLVIPTEDSAQPSSFEQPSDLVLPEVTDIHFWDSNQASSHLANEDILDWLFRPLDQPLVVQEGFVSQESLASDFQQTENVIPRAYNCTTETVDKMRNSIIMKDGDIYLLDSITPQFVNWAVDEYWEMHNKWPILHRPTFNLNNCPPILLWAMITLSMFLKGNENSISLAVKVHQTLRHSVYMMPEFQTPTVWIFQTLLLAEIFELLASTEEQHNMASRFHGVLISTMRKAGRMNDEDDTGDKSIDTDWKLFIDQEKKRRIAFFAFVLDTQHCSFFNQPAAMFLSDMHFHLPCEESIWECADSKQWRALYSRYPRPPLFTTAVGAFLKGDQRALSSLSLTPWSSMILLHGLMSAGWSMKLRGKSSLERKIISSADRDEFKLKDWSTAIIKSYNGWLHQYQKNFINTGKLSGHHPYVLGCLTTYQIAHVLVNCPVDSFETFVINFTKGNAGYRSNKIDLTAISEWIRSDTVQDDLMHVLDLMEMYQFDGHDYDILKETALHRPWCLYLGSLTLWIYDFFCGDDERSFKGLSFKQCTSEFRTAIRRTCQNKKLSRFSYRNRQFENHQFTSCAANELLIHVIKMLQPTRWGVLQKRIKITEDLLRKIESFA